MSITDELREYTKHYSVAGSKKDTMLSSIADRIDKAHERELAEVASGWDYWESTHIELPKDADGEVWHVGDLVVGDVNPNNPKAVERMLWYGPDSGWQLETDTIIFPCPDRTRHYHEPTVEDVLREFAKCWDDHVHYAEGELVETFAEKLREVVEHEHH